MRGCYKNGINKVPGEVHDANVYGIAWKMEEERLARKEKREEKKKVTLRTFSWDRAA